MPDWLDAIKKGFQELEEKFEEVRKDVGEIIEEAGEKFEQAEKQFEEGVKELGEKLDEVKKDVGEIVDIFFKILLYFGDDWIKFVISILIKQTERDFESGKCDQIHYIKKQCFFKFHFFRFDSDERIKLNFIFL